MAESAAFMEGELSGGTAPVEPTTAAPEPSASVETDVPDSPEFDAAWDAAFGADSDSRTPADKGDVPADEAGTTADNADGESGDEPDGAVKPGDDADEVAADDNKGIAKPDVKAQEAIATLPRSLRSAAERAGYTDAELAADIGALGVERVSKHLEKLHGGFNDLSTRYSQIGRATSTPVGHQQPTAPAAPAASVAASIDALLEPKAMADFRAEYGDGIVDKVLKPLVAELQPVRQIVQQFQAQQRASLQQEINTIFGNLGAEFVPMYGKGGFDQVSGEAREHRQSVLREADMILLGAERAGVAMSHREAIERAHNLYVSPRRAEFERKSLAGKVQKRAGAITARPTQRRTPQTAAEGARKSDKTAMNALTKREAELGINFFED